MRRIPAILLVCALLCAMMPGFAASAEGPVVFSYDFDLNFRLDASAFPFREREHMQGYADLLGLVELKGNLCWCNETESMDLRCEVIPKTKPESAVSFRIFGLPTVKRVTTPLFGNQVACFYPNDVMRPALTIRETFEFPLPELLLLDPRTTTKAFRCFVDSWNSIAGDMRKGGTISAAKVRQIAEDWRRQLEGNRALGYWMNAVIDPLTDEGRTRQDLNALPELLLAVTKGKALKVRASGGNVTCENADGFVLWEQREDGNSFSYALHVPEEGLQYVPAFAVRKDEAGGKIAFALDLRWDRAEGAAADGMPDSRLGLRIRADGVPASLPAESTITGEIAQDGYMVPQFGFLLSGSTDADGKVALALSFADRPEAGEVFRMEGTVVPVERANAPDYGKAEVETDYNILTLDFSIQHDFIDSVKRTAFFGLLDFLYELPVSSCQSIMDDLESYGILQTALKK